MCLKEGGYYVKNYNMITVTCYNKKHTFPTAAKAKKFFWECAECSEGAERDRYMNILIQLRRGKKECHD